MALPYGVTTADIEARWRPLSDDETTVAFTLLQDAARIVDNMRPTLSGLVTAGDVSPLVVRFLLAEMVQRVLRNPDVLRGQNVGADGGVGVTFGQTEESRSATRLRILDDELAILDAAIDAAAATPVASVQSRKLRAWSDGPSTPDMTALPLP